ncbi:MAG: winged helix-turn-helix transcriptional regulator [Chloroflexia bacterium]|nr:winged helix-turn-helix transcriptional regulator [Chloroflexia bacterium]
MRKISKTNYQLDGIDKDILKMLVKNARVPFQNIAKKCKISGAAIHQRVQLMKQTGIIGDSEFKLKPSAMGYNTCALIGLQFQITDVGKHEEIFKKIIKIPQVVECYHISGRYSLFIKVYTKDNENLKRLIIDHLQSIPEVTNTETFISLDDGFIRQIPID